MMVSRWKAQQLQKRRKEYARNRDVIREQRRVSRLSNLEKAREKQREISRRWSRRPENKLKQCIYRAQRNGIPWKLHKDLALALFSQSCEYCGTPPDETPQGLNGIDRVNNDKGYVPSNVVAACYDCNLMKHTRSKEDWLQKMERIINYVRS
jgi:hypothetical protein